MKISKTQKLKDLLRQQTEIEIAIDQELDEMERNPTQHIGFGVGDVIKWESAPDKKLYGKVALIAFLLSIDKSTILLHLAVQRRKPNGTFNFGVDLVTEKQNPKKAQEE